MATSGTATWQATRATIIASALRKVGALASGATASSDQTTEGSEALNVIVKEWQNAGIQITWREIGTKALSAATPSWSADADTVGIRSASVTAGGFQHPMQVLTLEEWNMIPDYSATAGLPKYLYFDANTATIKIAPAGANGYTINYEKIRVVEDFTGDANNPDFPPRWTRACIYALAADLADEYGVDIQERGYLHDRAEYFLKRATMGDDITNNPANVKTMPPPAKG